MQLEEAKLQFIQAWGSLGSSWGISRSMAQIHALLLSSDRALSTEEVMEAIQLSRGNVNTNMRELIHWNLVTKQHKLGERKEFFVAGSDVWTMAKNIAQERKRRELMPIRDLLSEMLHTAIEGEETEVAHFKQLLQDLDDFVHQMDQLSELLLKINNNAVFKKVVKTLAMTGKKKANKDL